MSDDFDLIYAPEEEKEEQQQNKPWKVLIVDDEKGVHDITKLALRTVVFEERGLEFISAFSGEEARGILQKHPDIAVAFVDVVMENDRAGLDLIRHIRDDLKNKLIRLVLRTGQPGEAPERKVILDFDINDYKEKSELTSQKLFSTLLTSLRSYRDLESLEANRKGLRRVIESSSEMFRPKMLEGFIQGVLEQLIALLNLEGNSLHGYCDSLAIEHKTNNNRVEVVAATGKYKHTIGKDLDEQFPEHVTSLIREALTTQKVVMRDNAYVGYFKPSPEREDIIYFSSNTILSSDDADLVKLFLQNLAIAYENILLKDEIEGTQRDMVYMLGEAIETRSKETGNHVRRVAEFSYLIAIGIGLKERDAEILKIASPLHDFGKIGIPDAILHKPGKLDESEFEIMKSHASMGSQLLNRSDRGILKSAAIIAGEHHEKWDGSGYPLGTAGEDIHIYGRIVAVADVFDALGSRRSYKEPWPIDQILALLEKDKGIHFDPTIVDWVLSHADEMIKIMNKYPDNMS